MSLRRPAAAATLLLAFASACADDAGTTGSGGASSTATNGAGGTGPEGTGGGSSSSTGGGSTSTATSSSTSTSTSSQSSTSSGSTSGSGGDVGSGGGGSEPGAPIKNVFIITMENHNWDEIEGNGSAPYINGTLVPMAARAGNYMTPPDLHPSEPNYIWVEAGDNLGIDNDDPPADNMQLTTEHLTTQLDAAGIPWKSYAQGIDGSECPLEDTGLFSPKHTPQLYFSDVTDNNSPSSQYCIDHVRPYEELGADLSAGDVARYNFITPDLCNDMHGQAFGFDCNMFLDDLIAFGDAFLSEAIPQIMGSAAYQDGGLIIVWWDEGTESLGSASDGPLPFFVISANAKAGYTGNVPYTHSSTLRSLQDIFAVQPYLRDAENAETLSDLFTFFP